MPRDDYSMPAPGVRSNAWWKNWKALLLGLLLAALPIALGYYVIVSPTLTHRERLAVDVEKLRDKNAKSKDVHDHWPEFQAKANEVRAKYDLAISQIPEIPEREVLAGEVEKLCADVNQERGARGAVSMHSTFFDSGKPKDVQPDKPGFASVSELPLRLEFRGNWAGYKSFVSRLRNNERLIKVRSFVMTTRGDRATATDNINFAVDASTYFKRFTPPDAATAGAPPKAAEPARQPAETSK